MLMKALTIDIGGTHVRILATGRTERREFESGPKLTAPAHDRWCEETN
jgi:polyphosphate glucokinase